MMNFRTNPVLVGLLLILGGLFVWYFQTIFIYIILSAILSLICHPLVKFYGKIRVGSYYLPRFAIALMVLSSLLLVLVLLVATIIPILLEEVRLLSSLSTDQVMASFHGPIDEMESLFMKFQTTDTDSSSFQVYIREKITSFLSFTRISDLLNSAAGFTGGMLAAVFSILFMTFFFLKDENLVYQMLVTLIPKKHGERVKNILNESQRMLTRYFLGTCLQMIIVFALLATGLSIFGVKNAFVIAGFAAIMNIIPYIGPIIGAVFGLIIGVSTSIGMEFYVEILPLVLKITGVFATVFAIDGIVSAPIIFSAIVKAHPLEIFIVILFAGTLAGIPGMILAIPAYTILRIVAREFLQEFRMVGKITNT